MFCTFSTITVDAFDIWGGIKLLGPLKGFHLVANLADIALLDCVKTEFSSSPIGARCCS